LTTKMEGKNSDAGECILRENIGISPSDKCRLADIPVETLSNNWTEINCVNERNHPSGWVE
jgi:hypothetical protein